MRALGQSRLMQAFLAVAVVHAVVVGVLQGAALRSCAEGADELGLVRKAAEEAQVSAGWAGRDSGES